MNYTPRTDALEKIDRNEWDKDPHSPEERFDYFLVYDIAREFERELAAKDAGIASMRVQLRDADKEMLRFHRLEDELTVKYAELADAKTTIANMTEALEAVLESPLPARKFFTLAAALKTKKEASQ